MILQVPVPTVDRSLLCCRSLTTTPRSELPLVQGTRRESSERGIESNSEHPEIDFVCQEYVTDFWNSTNEYCLTSTLSQVQNVTGQDVTADFFLNVLTGSGDSISQLSNAFESGEFCTGCVAT